MLDILLEKAKGRKLKAGLFGLGKSNLGVIEFLLNRKIEFDLTLRSDKEIPLEIEADRIFLGPDAYRDIDEDILFLSPSVRRDHPRITDGIKRGVCISSDTELFFSLAKERIFAIRFFCLIQRLHALIGIGHIIHDNDIAEEIPIGISYMTDL